MAGLLNSRNGLVQPAITPLSRLGLPGIFNNNSPKWIAVRQRFTQFHRNLVLTDPQRQDGLTKCSGVVTCLNRHYYGTASLSNAILIGSWDKDTAVRPPRDVDLYFLLPPHVFSRFQERVGNRQSALLQEVKNILSDTYPDTDMRGDGQVVLVRFASYAVEVVPAFLLTNGRYWICNTHDGGSYIETDPAAEVNFIETVDRANNRNLRPLIRMLKIWQQNCSVPISSFQLELIAVDFLRQSLWRYKDFFWFDWIIRDFFGYLYHRANTFVFAPGIGKSLFLGDGWQSRVISAYSRAVDACEYEKDNLVSSAGEEWQKIFGSQIPRTI